MQDEILSPSDYIDRIDDVPKKAVVKAFFASAQVMFRELASSWSAKLEMPQLRIRMSDAIDPEGNSFAIYLTSGLIEYCLEQSFRGSNVCNRPELIAQLPRAWLETLVFLWVAGHEFYHGARNHDERARAVAEAGLHDQPSIARGTEYDADLSAAASIFRIVQHELQKIDSSEGFLMRNDLVARQITLFAVFNALRRAPRPPPSSNSHTSHARRLIDLVFKLSMVGLKRHDPVDLDCKTKETGDRCKALIFSLVRFEFDFQTLHGSAYGDLHKDFLEEISSLDLSHVEAWGAMDAQNNAIQRERFESRLKELNRISKLLP